MAVDKKHSNICLSMKQEGQEHIVKAIQEYLEAGLSPSQILERLGEKDIVLAIRFPSRDKKHAS